MKNTYDEFADVVIVGAGHAGAQASIALRQLGFDGSVFLIGAEPEPPYERPPLSKDYLFGDKLFERLLIRPAEFYETRNIVLKLGAAVETVDVNRRVLGLSSGARIGYGTLVWAAGGRPRKLTCSGHHLLQVHSVRTRADVDALVAQLPDIAAVVVIGGGYIGLEAAAVLTKLGKHVTIVETQDRVLARVAGESLSRFYEDEHRRHGVTIRLGVQVKSITKMRAR